MFMAVFLDLAHVLFGKQVPTPDQIQGGLFRNMR
jgi:hypothetical protein